MWRPLHSTAPPTLLHFTVALAQASTTPPGKFRLVVIICTTLTVGDKNDPVVRRKVAFCSFRSCLIRYNQFSGSESLVRLPAASVFPGPHSASRSYQHVNPCRCSYED